MNYVQKLKAENMELKERMSYAKSHTHKLNLLLHLDSSPENDQQIKKIVLKIEKYL